MTNRTDVGLQIDHDPAHMRTRVHVRARLINKLNSLRVRVGTAGLNIKRGKSAQNLS